MWVGNVSFDKKLLTIGTFCAIIDTDKGVVDGFVRSPYRHPDQKWSGS